jgi:hypothetical protein
MHRLMCIRVSIYCSISKFSTTHLPSLSTILCLRKFAIIWCNRKRKGKPHCDLQGVQFHLTITWYAFIYSFFLSFFHSSSRESTRLKALCVLGAKDTVWIKGPHFLLQWDMDDSFGQGQESGDLWVRPFVSMDVLEHKYKDRGFTPFY